MSSKRYSVEFKIGEFLPVTEAGADTLQTSMPSMRKRALTLFDYIEMFYNLIRRQPVLDRVREAVFQQA